MSVKRRRILLLQTWWENRMLEGVARFALERNWILDCEMGWSHNLPKHWKGDGIIVYASDVDRQVINFVRKQRVPTIDLATFGNLFENSAKVTISNEAIARLAVTHLRELGFQDLGCVVASDHPVDRLRVECYRREVQQSGGRFHLLPLSGLGRQLKNLPRPMGLLTTKDQYALEVILICHDSGYHVPEEFAVVGVNDTPLLCDLTAIPLTSVNPDFEGNGYLAATWLERLIDGESPPKDPVTVAPREIIHRRSTDIICIPNLDTAKALRNLRDKFLQPISIQEVAAGLKTPLSTIQALFRQHTGRTLAQERVRLRIEHAKELLKDPRRKIGVVASESGFSSRTHFIRAFRKLVGINPPDFRKSRTEKPVSEGK